MNELKLSHLDSRGEAEMVDVSEKQNSVRSATAECEVVMKASTLRLLRAGGLKKGDAFTVAKIAGIQAAKKTAELIPLCHPLALDHMSIDFFDLPDGERIKIRAVAKITAKTGVEMEALTAASVAALTLYDMAKSVDPGITIRDLHVAEKRGGQSDFSH